MKNNIFLVILLLFVGSGLTYAKRISETEALRIVEQLQAKKNKGGNSLRRSSVSVADNADKNYYVINDHTNGGYYFVSASDQMGDMILGHATHGEYDEETINKIPALRELLLSYSNQIEDMESKPTTLRAWVQPGSICFGDDIEPFIATEWGQMYPYNLEAPDSTATGCGATAMAQVLKYYGSPTTVSVGIPSYISRENSMDSLPPTSFDYSSMLNQYDTIIGNTTNTEESKREVAKLMKYCGRSTKMQYGEESGTTIIQVYEALQKYFGFSSKMKIISGVEAKNNGALNPLYTEETWGNLLYKELSHKRPILMNSVSMIDGHAYICCGYSWGEGFYYNWGWNGEGDGYYHRPSHQEKMQGLIYDIIITGVEPQNPINLNGCDLEISEMNIKSTYVKYDHSTIELKVKNVGDKVFSDYFFLSSNEFINDIESNTITLNKGEEGFVKFNYDIMGTHPELVLEIITSDGVLVADSTIQLGKYNHDYSKIQCQIMEDRGGAGLEDVSNTSNDGPPFPRLHGNRRNPLYINITNNSDTIFRDIMTARLVTHDSIYVDTFIYNDDTYLEIFPYESFDGAVYLKSKPQEDYCPISILMVGNYLHTIGSFYFEDCYETKYKDVNGSEKLMSVNSNKIPYEAAYVNLTDFPLDSLDLSVANPNCLFYCSSIKNRPFNLDKNVVANDSSELISISAGNSFKSFTPIFADSVEFTIDFDLGDDGYTYKVLYLPFTPQFAYSNDGKEILKSGNMEISEFKGIDDENNISFISTKHIEGNKVYLIKAPAPTARGLNSVRFVANNTTIAPTQDILIELKKEDILESSALLSSSTEGTVWDKSDYMVSYAFDPNTKTFKQEESMFSDLHPFEAYIVDNLGFEDNFNVIVSTDIENLTQNHEKWVDMYLPNGIFVGTFLMKNGYVENLPEGVYVSKGKKQIKTNMK